MSSDRPERPNFADLHLLTVLAQTQSYTQTAVRLGLSKASVSQRVSELERAAGVQLVRRTTRSVRLTDAAQQLVGDTEGAFTRIQESFAALRDLAGAARGTVRLSCPVALGRQHVAPMVHEFLQRYPEIRVELDLNDRLVNLAQEGFDLAVRHTQLPPETHVAWTLAPSRSLLVASAAYLRRRPAPQDPSGLAEHDCLLYLRQPAERTWSFARGSGRGAQRAQVTVNGPLRANNSEVLRDAVLAGLGIALLPDFSAAAELAAGRLLPVLPEWRPLGFFGDRIYAIRPPSTRVPRAVQCLVQALKEGFRRAAAA